MKHGRDFLVYLAGPISGLTYDEAQAWRDLRKPEPASGNPDYLAAPGQVATACSAGQDLEQL